LVLYPKRRQFPRRRKYGADLMKFLLEMVRWSISFSVFNVKAEDGLFKQHSVFLPIFSEAVPASSFAPLLEDRFLLNGFFPVRPAARFHLRLHEAGNRIRKFSCASDFTSLLFERREQFLFVFLSFRFYYTTYFSFVNTFFKKSLKNFC